jgi:putative Mg2+ transporter-C (MgtC) family protein
MTIPIEQAAINLAVALALSAVIGFERQWRNRLAGLRTNTLVALGAATFINFAALTPGEASPTRVAASFWRASASAGSTRLRRSGARPRSAFWRVEVISFTRRWRQASSYSSTFSCARS